MSEQRRRTRAVANECLDMLCRGEAVEARRLARMSAADCPGLADEIRSLREAASGLSIAPRSPDVCEAVLGRLEAQHRFVPVRHRRRVSLSRVAVAVGLVLIASLAALRQRLDPSLPAPAPINSISVAVPADAAAMKCAANAALDSVASSVAASVASCFDQPRGGSLAIAHAEPGRRALALGDTSRYGVCAKPELPSVCLVYAGSGALAFEPFLAARTPLAAPGSAEFQGNPWRLGVLTPGPTTTSITRRPPELPLADGRPQSDPQDSDRRSAGDDGHK